MPGVPDPITGFVNQGDELMERKLAQQNKQRNNNNNGGGDFGLHDIPSRYDDVDDGISNLKKDYQNAQPLKVINQKFKPQDKAHLYYTEGPRDIYQRPDLDASAQDYMTKEYIKDIQLEDLRKHYVQVNRNSTLKTMEETKQRRLDMERKTGVNNTKRNPLLDPEYTRKYDEDEDFVYRKYVDDNRERIYLQQVHRYHQQKRLFEKKCEREIQEQKIQTYYQRKCMKALYKKEKERTESQKETLDEIDKTAMLELEVFEQYLRKSKRLKNNLYNNSETISIKRKKAG